MYTLSNQETDYVKIEMQSGDSLVIELDGKSAPITVANFKKLVGQGFYNGLIFHRVISGFMIQGGDPEGTGMGGSKENIRGEFLYNGFKNTISHVRGVISMARAQNPNSASSQFFICHADAKFLDGQYAGFGKVVEGIETVDKIASVATNYNDKPLTPQVMSKVYFVTK
jgi:peptidyl-prolyl cis-trans isomerase B (cyclophilin B)